MEAPGVEIGLQEPADDRPHQFIAAASTDPNVSGGAPSSDVSSRDGRSRPNCNGCNELREQVDMALTELARGRLDLARARLETVSDALHGRADETQHERLRH